MEWNAEWNVEWNGMWNRMEWMKWNWSGMNCNSSGSGNSGNSGNSNRIWNGKKVNESGVDVE
jgi:hypothetical protein